MLSHVRVDHFKHLPFKCDQCDKRFDLEAKRIRHVKTVHATELNYQCDKCDKCYKQQNSLYEHLNKFMQPKSINVIILDVTKATVFGAICMLTKNGFTKSIGLKS